MNQLPIQAREEIQEPNMQILNNLESQMMTPLPDTTSASATATPPASANPSTGVASTALGNESTFLQLLVAQIQNQDPTQPMDSSTFLTQLAEFSQVEQLIGIRQDVALLDPPATSTPATPTTNPTSGS